MVTRDCESVDKRCELVGFNRSQQESTGVTLSEIKETERSLEKPLKEA